MTLLSLLFAAFVAAAAPASQPTVPDARYRQGQTFQVGDWQYTVAKVEWDDKYAYAGLDGKPRWRSPREGRLYMRVQLTVENKGSQAAEIPPLRLIDTNGRRYEPFRFDPLKTAPPQTQRLNPDTPQKTGDVWEVVPRRYHLLVTDGDGAEAMVILKYQVPKVKK